MTALELLDRVRVLLRNHGERLTAEVLAEKRRDLGELIDAARQYRGNPANEAAQARLDVALRRVTL